MQESVKEPQLLDWGEHRMQLDAQSMFRIGKLQAVLERSRKDWVIEYSYDQDRYVRSSALANTRVRSVFSETDERVRLQPASPDRNVVATPVDTLHIPPGQRVTLYISSPVWLQVHVHAEADALVDVPVEILSDTWFGPNTREGELCYSCATNARVFLDRLTLRPERIFTPATLVNEGTDSMTVDRLNLPLPLLSIYKADDGMFWTQEMVIRRAAVNEEAAVDFEPKPPEHIDSAELITGPRSEQDDSSITRALSMLFT